VNGDKKGYLPWAACVAAASLVIFIDALTGEHVIRGTTSALTTIPNGISNFVSSLIHYFWSVVVDPTQWVIIRIVSFVIVLVLGLIALAGLLLVMVICLVMLVLLIPAALVVMVTHDIPGLGGPVEFMAMVLTAGTASGTVAYGIGVVAYPLLAPVLKFVGAYGYASTIGALFQNRKNKHSAARHYRQARSTILPIAQGAFVMDHASDLPTTVLHPQELAAARQQFGELTAHGASSENALVVLGRELATRLNLRQQIKSMDSWAEFYKAVTQRTAAFDEAVTTYYRVFGSYPADLPRDYVHRIQTRIATEREQEQFVDDKRRAENSRDRATWRLKDRTSLLEGQAAVEEAGARLERARLEKAQTKKQRAALNQQPPAPEKQLSREQRAAKLKKEFESMTAEIKAAAHEPETEKRLLRYLEDDYRNQLNKLYGR